MKKLIIFSQLLVFSLFANAERFYHIEKLRNGGDGTGMYDRVVQSSWSRVGSDYTTNLSCSNPGPNGCVVQNWPAIANPYIPVAMESCVINNFEVYMAQMDIFYENNNWVNNTSQVQIMCNGLIIPIIFMAFELDGKIIYEMHTVDN